MLTVIIIGAVVVAFVAYSWPTAERRARDKRDTFGPDSQMDARTPFDDARHRDVPDVFDVSDTPDVSD